ncbi:ras-related protein Rab-37-like [Silurus asotus]|uniref:Ras-related protein Rab-37-like n=1 Tax=Silurus asotus TaxID=30991 RepID=A0AAD5A1E8_SILAS|nr:ras-related protein Rab-37-like [Silurus asotus]
MEPETRREPEAREEPGAEDDQSCTVYGLYDQDLTHKVTSSSLNQKVQHRASVLIPPNYFLSRGEGGGEEDHARMRLAVVTATASSVSGMVLVDVALSGSACVNINASGGVRTHKAGGWIYKKISDCVKENRVKTILVGDSGVGKTSLLVQFDQGKFIPGSFSATVGIGFTIWDTAGQERFRSVTHAYYRDAHALLLLYDITNKSSFDNIRAWLTEIHEYAQSDAVIMLLGNKADMCSGRVIKREDGERLAREYGVIFMETSAKTGVNVDLAFMTAAKCELSSLWASELFDVASPKCHQIFIGLSGRESKQWGFLIAEVKNKKRLMVAPICSGYVCLKRGNSGPGTPLCVQAFLLTFLPELIYLTEAVLS